MTSPPPDSRWAQFNGGLGSDGRPVPMTFERLSQVSSG